jgi:hypothetical protein
LTDPTTAYNEGYDGPDPDAAADLTNPAQRRMFDDPAPQGGTVHEPDKVAHSVEAMAILRKHGVAAYLAYLRR